MKKNGQVAKSIVFMGIFLMLFTLSNRYLSFSDSLIRNRIQQIYQKDQTIDMVILGNSHALRGINPQIFDDELGTYSITLASPGQELNQSYYLLSEMFAEQEVDLVVLELFSLIVSNNDKVGREPESRYNKYRDYVNEIPFSPMKIRMVYDTFEWEVMPEMLFPVLNSHEVWREPGIIGSNISYRFDPAGKGTIEDFQGVMSQEDANFYDDTDFQSDFTLSKEGLIWLEKIIHLAEDNDAQLQLTMVPMYKGFLDKTNYGELKAEIGEFLSERGRVMLDLNEGPLGEDRGNFADEPALKSNGQVNTNQHASFRGQYYISREILAAVKGVNREGPAIIEQDRFTAGAYLKTLESEGKYVVIAGLEHLQGALDSSGIELLDGKPGEKNDFLFLDRADELSPTYGKWQSCRQEDACANELPVIVEIHEVDGLKTLQLNGDSFVFETMGLMVLVFDPGVGEVTEKAFFDYRPPMIRYQWH